MLELEIRAIEETLSKHKHLAAFSAHLELACSEGARQLIRMAPRLHPDLWVRIIDIQQYRPTLVPEGARPFPP